MSTHFLHTMLAPAAVAVIGASEREGAVGTVVFRNLLAGFTGKLYPVNPRHARIQNQEAYPSIGDIRQPVELAVIATPAPTVPDLIRQCGEAGIAAVVVISAGFGEAGDSGLKLQNAMLNHARHYGIRIIGPNCLGIMRPATGLNATFGHNIASAGQLALVSQSGALCTAMLDWAQNHEIGFSAVFSLGDAADVDFGDLLSFLALDKETRAILLYVEGIRDARSFLSGLRVAARMKPVIVVKGGRYQEGSRAAMSHTGAMVGSDAVFHAALRRAGAVRAYTIKQLFAAANLLASGHCRLLGNRLAIITNGGGPGVLATDRAIEAGVALAPLEQATIARLNEVLPPHWSHGNPVDILGDADAARYRHAIEACLADNKVDGVLAMLTPQAMTDAIGAARVAAELAHSQDKPLLTCWMGGTQVREAHALFGREHIAHFDTPETAVEAFSYLASFQRNQEMLLQVPAPLDAEGEPDVEGARLIIEEALASGRNRLSDMESFAVLKAFGLPVARIMEAHSPSEALVMAETLGFPIAMKIHSPDIPHKSDVAGVRLNISNAAAVRNTYQELFANARAQRPDADLQGVTLEPMYTRGTARELFVGVVNEPVFGPAISIGSGGTMIEVMDDTFVALPPLNRFIARQMIDRTRASQLLGEFRGLPAVNLSAIEKVLLGISDLVCELPHIRELDINPLLVDETGALVVDARIGIGYPDAGARRYDHMAIHPYPGHLARRKQLPDGSNITIRPIRPEDAEIEQAFIRRLSPRSKFFRFMQTLHELTLDMLVRFTQIDYDREMALIAVAHEGGQEIEVGVARYVINPDDISCEFAIVIADEWHHKGLGIELMQQLMEIARARGLKEMAGEVLADNREMLGLAKSLGFEIRTSREDQHLMEVSKAL